MTKQTVTRLALAAGCAIARAAPAAQAQVHSEWSGSPVLNNRESRDYMRLLQTNRSFREARIRKECGPITDQKLHQNCLASFEEYTPFVGSTRMAGNEWYPPNPQPAGGAYDTTSGLTGSSAGTMSTTTTMGTTGYDNYNYRDAIQGGYGSSTGEAPPYAYGTPPYATDPYAASRNLPAEDSGGMIRAPGAMPHYPGPRPSGPLSGK
jgi:hypothetical protein